MIPLAVDPNGSFRKMIALSVAVHVGGAFLSAASGLLRPPPLSITPVAVVDLVGGADLSSPPQSSRAEAPPAPQRKAGKTSLREQRRAEAKKRKEAAKKNQPVFAKAPDTSAFSDTIRRMREESRAKESVREAVGTIRKEEESRRAIRNIGERVAHRVDLSSVRPAPGAAAPPASAGLGGAQGSAKVSPENMAYFRALDERIRSSWTVPALPPEEMKKLMVQVRITIEKDGRVSDVRMEKTAGNTYFDDSVRRAIQKASPLPVPPEQLRGGEGYYEVGFRFYGAGGGQ